MNTVRAGSFFFSFFIWHHNPTAHRGISKFTPLNHHPIHRRPVVQLHTAWWDTSGTILPHWRQTDAVCTSHLHFFTHCSSVNQYIQTTPTSLVYRNQPHRDQFFEKLPEKQLYKFTIETKVGFRHLLKHWRAVFIHYYGNRPLKTALPWTQHIHTSAHWSSSIRLDSHIKCTFS